MMRICSARMKAAFRFLSCSTHGATTATGEVASAARHRDGNVHAPVNRKALMMALSQQLSSLVVTHAPFPWRSSSSPAIATTHPNAIQCRFITSSHVQVTRRQALLAGGLLPGFLFFPSTNSPAAVAPATIDFSKAPSRAFDAGDARLREAANLFQEALNATTVEEEEKLWTQVIDNYGSLDAEWVPDIVSRAWGNRGNSRSRQGKMEEALADFDRSIALAPYAADPVLNRGVTLESLGRYEEAAADYQAVLLAQPNDPAAWNNLGNVKAALGQYDEALSNYRRAVQLAPEFSFAAANYALILYQVGKENEAFKQFRSLLRRYPEFPDVRAALAVALYAQGLTAEAETNWGRLEDGRYRDRNWVRYTRKWPPRLVKALEGFLDVKAVAS